ncbi:MAG: AraC family transcriptional regulator [Spirochaetota bacterium]
MTITVIGRGAEANVVWDAIPGMGALKRKVEVPRELGTGSVEQIQFREQFTLFISEVEFSQDIQLETVLEENTLEVLFCLAGEKQLNLQEETISLQANEGGLFYNHCGSTVKQQFFAGNRVHMVGVFLSPEFLQHYRTEFAESLFSDKDIERKCAISLQSYANQPRISLLLQDIVQFSQKSPFRYIYLEAKALELVSLQLDALLTADQSASEIPDVEVHKLNKARKILQEEYLEPPSILELSRRVFLNEFKLKSGFKHLFGTSVYSYLRDYRMEVARSLLDEGKQKVLEVACAVGYSNPSHFAVAFRKRYGINPGELLKSEDLSKKK